MSWCRHLQAVYTRFNLGQMMSTLGEGVDTQKQQDSERGREGKCRHPRAQCRHPKHDFKVLKHDFKVLRHNFSRSECN
ncbi:hypothetical protein CsSME_00045594 [Camellia sinensis var. sinensis]